MGAPTSKRPFRDLTLGHAPSATKFAAFSANASARNAGTETELQLATSTVSMQCMHMHRIFLTDEAKKKLWRPCREARALGL